MPVQRGAQQPIITVETFPGADDAGRTVRLTVIPRSVWCVADAGFQRFYDHDGFDPDEQYVVAFSLRHPGTEVGRRRLTPG